MIQCPCGSASFTNCCESVIQLQSATTALSLMKSRYTAYCIGDAEYLYNTVQSKNRKHYNRNEIVQWSKENIWLKLEIIRCQNGTSTDTTGIVEFKAYYRDASGHEQIHHEISNFCKEHDRWFYVDGKFVPQKSQTSASTDRNALCPCGSGKKYKKCCLSLQ